MLAGRRARAVAYAGAARSAQRLQLAVTRCQQLHSQISEVSRVFRFPALHARLVAFVGAVSSVRQIWNQIFKCNIRREGSKKTVAQQNRESKSVEHVEAGRTVSDVSMY